MFSLHTHTVKRPRFLLTTVGQEAPSNGSDMAARQTHTLPLPLLTGHSGRFSSKLTDPSRVWMAPFTGDPSNLSPKPRPAAPLSNCPDAVSSRHQHLIMITSGLTSPLCPHLSPLPILPPSAPNKTLQPVLMPADSS